MCQTNSPFIYLTHYFYPAKPSSRMASSSLNGFSPVRTLSNNYESDSSDGGGFHRSSRMSPETMEKSLTNINIHIASISSRREEQTLMMKDFIEKYYKEQEKMAEETKQLRLEMAKLRNNIYGGA